jgi:uncharacterized protein (TIGR03083 family)
MDARSPDAVAEWSAAHVRVAELVRAADGERPVPACPAWTVRQLLAHMVGLGVDVVAGNEPDDHNAVWTQRHVDDRSDASIAELLAEWDSVTGALIAWMREHTTRPLNDVIIHEQDLRGALAQPGARDTPGLQIVRDRILDRFARRLVDRLPVRLQAEGWAWTSPGVGEPALVLQANGFDLARAVMSRRSAAQLQAWTTRGDLEPYLAAFEVLGPLPAQDLAD